MTTKNFLYLWAEMFIMQHSIWVGGLYFGLGASLEDTLSNAMSVTVPFSIGMLYTHLTQAKEYTPWV